MNICTMNEDELSQVVCVEQIEDMLNEVKFKHYVDTGECAEGVDLPSFIKCE